MPLRFPQIARAAAMLGLATVPIVALSVPAYADSVHQREWWLSALHVSQAWRSGAGTGVTVAVLADGVVATQPDLVGRVTQGPDYTRSGRKPGSPHYGVVGTGIASLIAGHGHGPKDASGNYTDGIYGISNDARILSIRVTLSPGDPLWSNSGVTSRLPGAIAAGIRYAVKHRASVIELPADPGVPGVPSWGAVHAIADGSAAERAAIAYAVSKDVFLVAPAGDNAQSGDAVNYPAAYSGVIAVGAFGKNFVKTQFSNRQGYVALTAAGQDMVAAAPAGYQTMNSTWAASAVVAGIAALVRSQFPDLTATQVGQAMEDSTVYGHRQMSNGSGRGTVDAASTIRQASTMSPPHAHSAAFGARARIRPVAPPIPSQTQTIMRDVTRDGAISGALLAALLVPISFYGATTRRRDKRLALAERQRLDRARPESSSMLADPLLEFFGPQHARPADQRADQRPVASLRYQPKPSLSGRSSMSARPLLAASGASGPGVLPAPTAPEISSATAGPTLATGLPLRKPGETMGPTRGGSAAGPAGGAGPGAAGFAGPSAPASPGPGAAGNAEPPRQDTDPRGPVAYPGPGPTVRHARVAGSPPWEPAQQPTTALPWAVIPAPSAGPGSRTGSAAEPRPAPPESVWNETVSPAPPNRESLFDPRPQPRVGPDRLGPTPFTRPNARPAQAYPPQAYPAQAAYQAAEGHSAEAHQAQPSQPSADPVPGAPAQSDTGGRPIYVWNPGATESIPFIVEAD